MQRGDKTKDDFEQLKQVYKTWEQFMSKSKIKMRKKAKKDKKEYYDFDYTRGQYYYNYPEYHINFAPPEVQKSFFKQFLLQQSKPISDVYYSELLQGGQIEQMLRPQELHDFLKDIRSKFQKQIATLRIQKSLYIQQSTTKSEVVDFMEDQIRSYNFRLIRFQNIYFNFEKSMSQRLQDRTTSLKLKKFDQMHFADIEKGDFVVYLRMEGVEQRLCFELNRLTNEFQLSILSKKAEIIKRCYQKRGANIKIIEKIHAQLFLNRKHTIEKYFIENDPIFFDSEENLKTLGKYLQKLNYTKQMNKSRLFFDVNFSLKELNYIPSNEMELKQILYSACSNYFPNEMIQNLYTHKKQHLCYRLNYFASIVLRTIVQSYNFIVEIKQKDLHTMRNTMKRQLETIFTNESDKLFNILQHQIICLVDQGSYQSPHFPNISSSQNQNIFKAYFSIHKLVDPFTRSILNLVSTSNDKTIKQVVANYVSWIQQIIPNKLKYISLYYKNFHSDNKSHLINLLNSKLIINAFSDNLLEPRLDKIMNPNDKIDEGLMKIAYLLFAINNIQVKKQLDNIINAQVAIMLKVKYRLDLLQYKHHMPFQMTPEFIARFTESNYSHDFISEHQLKNPAAYPNIENHDKICRVKSGSSRERVQVRRVIPENPLFEGKKILYNSAIKECNQLLDKLHNICAYMIEQRQNYLHEQKLSGIVDRYQLVNSLLKLEIEYQDNKLKYMEEVLLVFQHTVNPEGVYSVAQEMYAVKNREVYFNLNQTHFEEHYANETSLWRCKASVLAKLRNRQMDFEDSQKKKFRENLIKSNHVNNLPQISSVYYSDELAMEAEDNIVEQAEQESLSQVISESQFMNNTSSKYKSDISAISSQYHVKTTFKQILGRNSVNAQATDQNRREQLMGRKKKKLLNDSVLGGILIYDECKYYRFIHKTIHFMSKLEQMFNSIFHTEDPGIKNGFYEEINTLIDTTDKNPIKDVNLIDQNMLNRILADCNRVISKVVEKHKVNPSSLDDYHFFNSQIFKNLLDNSSFANLNSIRGIYTCLNIVKIYKKYPQYLQNKLVQSNIAKQFGTMAKKYSSQSLSRETKFTILQHLRQRYDICNFVKAIDTSIALSPSKSFLFLCNNATLSLAIFAVNEAIGNYYRQLLKYHYEQIFDYKSFLTNLELLQAYGVYFNDKILNVTGIENRLNIRRKIQSMSQRLGRLFKIKNIEELISLPNSCILLLKKQQNKIIESEVQILQNIEIFEDFTIELASAAVLINTAAYKLKFTLSEKTLHERLEVMAKILPFASTYIQIKPISEAIYKQMFQDNFKIAGVPIFQGSRETQKTFIFQFKRMTVQNLTKSFHRDSITDIKLFVRPLFERKYKEFQLSQHALERYYDYMQVSRFQEPYSIGSESKLKDIFDYSLEIKKKINLLTWIQCKLLLFGASLRSQELFYFRCILENIAENSQIFFRDESSRLVNYHDIMKMKIDSLDSNSINEKYIYAFLNYQNLKGKYKSFLDGLGELDIDNEGKEIINVVYIGNKKLFNYLNNCIPDYLSNYCSMRRIKNQTSLFVQFASKNNPNRYLRGPKARPLTFTVLKTFLWDIINGATFKQDIFFIEERCEVIKQTLNSNNTKMKDLTIELSLQLFTRERMRELHEYLQISITKRSRIQYTFFLKKLQEKLLLGIDKLNPIEKYLSKFIEKILKEKPDLVNLKDQIIEKIYESRFYKQLILSKLDNMSMEALNKQLKLYQILFENYQQRQMLRENRIIKNTLNKVLVPKIIINPYLESPLIVQNYFFAAALKLSYVDSFLNKLKNRAILVQLAEGGFGFLLKISELDECVQSLCKGIITFTEKEFNDRFRTFVESYDQLRQKYKKSVSCNQSLKNMVDICRQQWGKEIKSVIYSKLSSYIGTIHSKQKSYESIFNIIKSLELEIAKKIDLQYQQKVKTLQEENRRLKQQFIQFQKITAKNARTSMEQSKDMLYNTFKKDVESILNKEVVKDFKQLGEKQHEEQEEYTTTILLKKLRKQKTFYEMKISNMQSKLRQKSNEIMKLKEELTTIQNTLTSDQFRNSKLSEEIRYLLQRNIEIEDLKRQIHQKQEQETLSRLKLIKVNEHLQGRVTRLEQKNKLETSVVVKQSKKDEKDMGTQAVFLTEKRQRRNFKIKTEHSQQHSQQYSQQPIKNHNRVDEVPIWREKWQNSQRKYHILMSKIVQAYEIYRMNKNSSKLVDRISLIFQQCVNNQIGKRK